MMVPLTKFVKTLVKLVICYDNLSCAWGGWVGLYQRLLMVDEDSLRGREGILSCALSYHLLTGLIMLHNGRGIHYSE